MPTELPRLPRETREYLLNRGAAYCPALAYEVRELPQSRPSWFAWTLTNLLAPSTVIAFAVLVVVLWAKMLTGG